jgi:long-chain acyl-CoA synthetase
VNQKLPEAGRIARYELLKKELDADSAEVTRTRKLRRSFVTEKYKTLIESLYQ